jgi:hypothetical protein
LGNHPEVKNCTAMTGFSARRGARYLAWSVGFGLGCAAHAPATLEAPGDALLARVEEYRTRVQLSCAESCGEQRQVCALSTEVCAAANTANSGESLQRGCTAAQEECARFGAQCLTCKKNTN